MFSCCEVSSHKSTVQNTEVYLVSFSYNLENEISPEVKIFLVNNKINCKMAKPYLKVFMCRDDGGLTKYSVISYIQLLSFVCIELTSPKVL